MHGHFDSPLTEADVMDLSVADALVRERLNMGIAIVVPASKIMEVIDQPANREAELKVEHERLRGE
jgi:hypothetical protein